VNPRHPAARRAAAAAAHAHRHPVARAIAVQRIRSHLLDLRVHMQVLEHGEHCHAVLADAAWLVGLGTELALAVQHPSLRRMHGTLRGLVQIALEGYRWKAHMKQPIDEALQLAHDLLIEHEALAWQLLPGAEYLAQRFRARAIDGSEVAGAEIYAPAAPAETSTPTRAERTQPHTARP
jgi:hypothetical protein